MFPNVLDGGSEDPPPSEETMGIENYTYAKPKN
jgi:hypothetical protein